MNYFWYVCGEAVEEYTGQETDGNDSVIVFADSPAEALQKVMRYRRGMLERVGATYNDKNIEVIY